MPKRENMNGKKLKKFNFVQKLGSGAFGTVYKAVNTNNKDIVAIKVIDKSQMKQIPKLQKLVASQISILKEVNNQNVIKFVDSFSSDDCIFIATQFCNGGDLEKYCQSKGKLDQTQALTFLRQILNGFKGLHQINTMHRDFKLANVLLHNQVCKIADLGFAKQLKEKTLTTTTLGTDDTMAPEVHQGKQYGWGADIWSIGVVFYQLLYGKCPYTGPNDYAILKKIKTTKPDYSQRQISEQALDFIQKCLVIDPSKRISWKQMYNHQLILRSQMTLTTGALRSRISYQDNKNYYEKNEDGIRKTLLQIIDIVPKDEKAMFQSAGVVQNADNKAQIIKKSKEQLQLQFAQYQVDIIHSRNDKMFGITQILPLEKTLADIKIQHSRALYEICKNCFIEIKNYRKDLKHKSQKFMSFKHWKQFKEQDIYSRIEDQLFQDEIFAESLAISYRSDTQKGCFSQDQNMNRKKSKDAYSQSLQKYKRQLKPFVKDQSKKIKLKFIKMLKALQCMISQASYDSQRFDRQNENIDVKKQQTQLLNST